VAHVGGDCRVAPRRLSLADQVLRDVCAYSDAEIAALRNARVLV
jgi:hypothetical protein